MSPSLGYTLHVSNSKLVITRMLLGLVAESELSVYFPAGSMPEKLISI